MKTNRFAVILTKIAAASVATLTLGLSSGLVAAGELNIDTLIYKPTAGSATMPRASSGGAVIRDIDTLVLQPATKGTKSRAEVRSELSMHASGPQFPIIN